MRNDCATRSQEDFEVRSRISKQIDEATRRGNDDDCESRNVAHNALLQIYSSRWRALHHYRMHSRSPTLNAEKLKLIVREMAVAPQCQGGDSRGVI